MALLTHNRWAELVDGKYVDIDGKYGGQCWDTFADYCISVLGVPPINTWGGTWGGWAYAIWDQYHVNGAATYFDRIPAHEPSRAGDIPIWTDQHWYYPASHIAVTLADAGADLLCMSQNSTPARPWQNGYHTDATGPNARQYLTKQGLAGYLRRKTITPAAPLPAPPKLKEWDEVASKAEFKDACREVLTEPKVMDQLALAILKRPCYLVDPSGESFEITGTTNLATKINFAAHNDAQAHTLLAEIKAAVLGLSAPEPAPEPSPEALVALEAAVPPEVPPVASA